MKRKNSETSYALPAKRRRWEESDLMETELAESDFCLIRDIVAWTDNEIEDRYVVCGRDLFKLVRLAIFEAEKQSERLHKQVVSPQPQKKNAPRQNQTQKSPMIQSAATPMQRPVGLINTAPPAGILQKAMDNESNTTSPPPTLPTSPNPQALTQATPTTPLSRPTAALLQQQAPLQQQGGMEMDKFGNYGPSVETYQSPAQAPLYADTQSFFSKNDPTHSLSYVSDKDGDGSNSTDENREDNSTGSVGVDIAAAKEVPTESNPEAVPEPEEPEAEEKLNSSAEDPNTWSPRDVGNWLTRCGLGQYSNVFINQHVTGDIIINETETVLEELKIAKLHRGKFLREVRKISRHDETRHCGSPPRAHPSPTTTTPPPSPSKTLNIQQSTIKTMNSDCSIVRNVYKVKVTSKYLGVEFRPSTGKWCSFRTAEGKKTHGGSHNTELEAAHASDDLVRKYQTKGKLNFPKWFEKGFMNVPTYTIPSFIAKKK